MEEDKANSGPGEKTVDHRGRAGRGVGGAAYRWVNSHVHIEGRMKWILGMKTSLWWPVLYETTGASMWTEAVGTEGQQTRTRSRETRVPWRWTGCVGIGIKSGPRWPEFLRKVKGTHLGLVASEFTSPVWPYSLTQDRTNSTQISSIYLQFIFKNF